MSREDEEALLEHSQLAQEMKCPAALNIAGEHYQCQEPPHDHSGTHRNAVAAAIWSCGADYTKEER